MPWTNSAPRYLQYLNRIYDTYTFQIVHDLFDDLAHPEVAYACKLSRLIYNIDL